MTRTPNYNPTIGIGCATDLHEGKITYLSALFADNTQLKTVDENIPAALVTAFRDTALQDQLTPNEQQAKIHSLAKQYGFDYAISTPDYLTQDAA